VIQELSDRVQTAPRSSPNTIEIRTSAGLGKLYHLVGDLVQPRNLALGEIIVLNILTENLLDRQHELIFRELLVLQAIEMSVHHLEVLQRISEHLLRLGNLVLDISRVANAELVLGATKGSIERVVANHADRSSSHHHRRSTIVRSRAEQILLNRVDSTIRGNSCHHPDDSTELERTRSLILGVTRLGKSIHEVESVDVLNRNIRGADDAKRTLVNVPHRGVLARDQMLLAVLIGEKHLFLSDDPVQTALFQRLICSHKMVNLRAETVPGSSSVIAHRFYISSHACCLLDFDKSILPHSGKIVNKKGSRSSPPKSNSYTAYGLVHVFVTIPAKSDHFPLGAT